MCHMWCCCRNSCCAICSILAPSSLYATQQLSTGKEENLNHMMSLASRFLGSWWKKTQQLISMNCECIFCLEYKGFTALMTRYWFFLSLCNDNSRWDHDSKTTAVTREYPEALSSWHGGEGCYEIVFKNNSGILPLFLLILRFVCNVLNVYILSYAASRSP